MRWGIIFIIPILLTSVSLPLAGASATPHQACAPCGSGFAQAADVTVDRSTVLIALNSDGSASWTVRNTVGREAAQTLQNESNLTATAVEAVRSRGLPDYGLYGDGLPPARNVTAAVEADTVVIRFEHPDAAMRINDVIVLRYFHIVEGGHLINAENYTILGPPNTTVTNHPDRHIERANLRPSVEDRRITWRGSSSIGGQGLHRKFYVAFAADSDPLAAEKTRIAIARAIGPTVLDAFLAFVFFQTIFFAIAVTIISFATGRTTWATPVESMGLLAGGVGGLGILALVSNVLGVWAGSMGVLVLSAVLGMMYAAFALLGWWNRSAAWCCDPRRQALGALLAVGVTAGGASLLLAIVESTTPTLSWIRRAVVTLAPVAAFFPLGGAIASTDRWSSLRWGALTVMLFMLTLVTWVNLENPPTGGLETAAIWFISIVVAIGIPTLGVPLAFYGRSLARRR